MSAHAVSSRSAPAPANDEVRPAALLLSDDIPSSQARRQENYNLHLQSCTLLLYRWFLPESGLGRLGAGRSSHTLSNQHPVVD